MAEPQAVGDIIKSITDDVKILVRGEIELAKAELVPSAKKVGAGVGMFSAAGYFAVNALSLLFIAGALGISAIPGIHIAVAFVIMAVIVLLIAGILALIGRAAVKKAKGPDKAIAEAQTSVDSIKAAVERGTAAATAPRIEGKVVPSRELR